MAGLIAADKLKRLQPQRSGLSLLIEFLQGAPQDKGAKGLAFKAAAGCTQRHCLTRQRRHLFITPLGKEIVGVDGQSLSQQSLRKQAGSSVPVRES